LELQVASFFYVTGDEQSGGEENESCNINGYVIERIEVENELTTDYDESVIAFPFGTILIDLKNNTRAVVDARVFVRAVNSLIDVQSAATELISLTITERPVAPSIEGDEIRDKSLVLDGSSKRKIILASL
jgi:hypothetical protein